MITSPIAYPGAKGKVCNKLMAMIPDGVQDWREPFFGGGSVTIAFLQSTKGQNCKRFTVGDVYPEIFHFWTSVKEAPTELIQYAKEWVEQGMPSLSNLDRYLPGSAQYQDVYKQVTEVEAKQLWSWIRSVDVNTLTPVQRGARFYLSSKMSFSGVADSGGMSKENASSIRVNKFTGILEASKLLQPVDICFQSFEATIADTDRDRSFVFLDPPYITQEVGMLYGNNGSTHNGFRHNDLADLCMSLKCKWLMTIDDCVKARRLYDGAVIKEFYIPYTMSGLVGRDNRLNGEELIISNYDTENPNYPAILKYGKVVDSIFGSELHSAEDIETELARSAKEAEQKEKDLLAEWGF